MRVFSVVAVCLVVLGFAGAVQAQGRGGMMGGGGFGGGPGSQRNQGPVTKSVVEWIDTHIHLRAGDGNYLEAMRVAERMLTETGAAGFVLLPQPFPEKGNPNKHDFAEYLDFAKEHSGRVAFLGGGGSLNGILEKTAPDQVTPALRDQFTHQAEAILDAGAAGFGELALLHLSHFPSHPFEEVAPDHPLLLLLADIAGKRGKVIDVHMDLVEHAEKTPDRFSVPPNPSTLTPNLDAFERFVAHNRNARIVLAHAGWDVTGQWTPAVSRKLLSAHPNLYMSIKISQTGAKENAPVSADGVQPEWLELLREFPDRFVIGSDGFFAATQGQGAGTVFQPRPIQTLLTALPIDLAQQVAFKNAAMLYGLTGR